MIVNTWPASQKCAECVHGVFANIEWEPCAYACRVDARVNDDTCVKEYAEKKFDGDEGEPA